MTHPDDTAPEGADDEAQLDELAGIIADRCGVLRAHAADALRSLLANYATPDQPREFHHEHRTLDKPELVMAGDWPLADAVLVKSVELPTIPQMGPLAATLVTFQQLRGDEPPEQLSAQLFVADPERMRKAGRLLNDAMNEAANIAAGGNRQNRRRR